MITKTQTKLGKREYYYRSIGLDRLKMREKILSVIPNSFQDVLEIGTGKGMLTKLLAESAGQVTSVDIDTGEQKIARKLIDEAQLQDKVMFLIADAEQLPFAELSFDTIFCAYSFHHFKNPFKALDEMIRVFVNKLVLVEFNVQGFEAVNKAHELEGGIHEQNGIDFLSVKPYLENKKLDVKYMPDKWQNILIATKNMKGGD